MLIAKRTNMLWFEPEMSPTGLYFKRSLVSSTIFKAVEPLGSWTWLEEIGTAVIFFWICHRVRVFTTLSCCENPTMPSPPGGPRPLTQSAQMNPPLSCSSQVFGSWRWSKQLIQCLRNSVGVGTAEGLRGVENHVVQRTGRYWAQGNNLEP